MGWCVVDVEFGGLCCIVVVEDDVLIVLVDVDCFFIVNGVLCVIDFYLVCVVNVDCV